MNSKGIRIDLIKLILFVLKHLWVVIICAEIGFGALYLRTSHNTVDTFTAFGTMYVNNGNPNLDQYQYISSGDMDATTKLVDTYLVIVKSNKVMDGVTEKLSANYPGITSSFISGTLSMAPVSETGVVSVRSTTFDPKLASDIVNAILEVAPAEILRVAGGGNIEIIDTAAVPTIPDAKNIVRKALIGGVGGALLGGIILLILFLLNRRISDVKDLTDNYTPPVLASIQRLKEDSDDKGRFLLSDQTPMEIVEDYAKLRMNLLYTLVNKKSKAVVITSAVSGEGKSTIAANLAISCAMSGKKIVLVDGDMRRASQREIFGFDSHTSGLSDVLVGNSEWKEVILKGRNDAVDILPAGHFPPNPSELLESEAMLTLLNDLEQEYDLVLLDMPPINIVSDPLVMSSSTAGSLFVTRQNYSDQREIRKALISAEMTGMEILGFVFYGEKLDQGGYYNKRYYNEYYKHYENFGNRSSDLIRKTKDSRQ